MSGPDLQVLAFEQGKATLCSRGQCIAALGAELHLLRSVLGDHNVGGDACDQLAQQVADVASGLGQLGGAADFRGAAAGLQEILLRFQGVDQAQPVNARLGGPGS